MSRLPQAGSPKDAVLSLEDSPHRFNVVEVRVIGFQVQVGKVQDLVRLEAPLPLVREAQ